MATATVVNTSLDRARALQTKVPRPPRPPDRLAAVLLDQFDVGSELFVAIDDTDRMTVELRACGLDVSGAAQAVVMRFRDGSCCAVADVKVAGFNSLARQRAKGQANIGITWSASDDDTSPMVAGSATVDGDWTGGLFQFSVVARHSLHRMAVTFSSPNRILRFSPRNHLRPDR